MTWKEVKGIRWDLVAYIGTFITLVGLGAYQGAVWMFYFIEWIQQ